MFLFKIFFIILFRNKLNIKEAIDYITEAWENVTQITIRNCWLKTGILPSYDDDINMPDIKDNNQHLISERETFTVII